MDHHGRPGYLVVIDAQPHLGVVEHHVLELALQGNVFFFWMRRNRREAEGWTGSRADGRRCGTGHYFAAGEFFHGRASIAIALLSLSPGLERADFVRVTPLGPFWIMIQVCPGYLPSVQAAGVLKVLNCPYCWN